MKIRVLIENKDLILKYLSFLLKLLGTNFADENLFW